MDLDELVMRRVCELTAEVDRLTPLVREAREELARIELDRNYTALALLHLRHKPTGTESSDFQHVINRARNLNDNKAKES